ncbi:MAG: hypothetical protein VX217_06450 [Acidobacteriota bacterium]|nr:hypothetical protein [Acidobacteriota bacterium]
MRSFLSVALIFSILCISAPGITQEEEVAPIFQEVRGLMYETYEGVNRPVFNEYFEMLVEKYEGTDARWAIFNENLSVAHRITALPEGWDSVVAVTEERQASFQEFTYAQRALWDVAWDTRQVQLYGAMPALSYVPEGFTVEDIQQLPYHRVEIHHLKWDQAPAWREALARRHEIDREAGVDNMVLTTWNGGLGTEGMTVMIRIAAESPEADQAQLAERQQLREPYMDEIMELMAQMNAATRHVERHDQMRDYDRSHPIIAR